MRPAARLFAQAARSSGAGSGSYLTPLLPTGLTGILTHPSPRPHLIYLYNATLDKLKSLPENSVYRTSVEALTRHRLRIVESHVPAGYEEFAERVSKEVAENPQIFGPTGLASERFAGGKRWIVEKRHAIKDDREVEWDDDLGEERSEGPKTAKEAESQLAELGGGRPVSDFEKVDYKVEDEPALTKDQISSIEDQIGAGLLEEVVIVAERELDLVDTMKEAAVWEELVEKPVEGQWEYFERGQGRHMGGTQPPPS